MAQALRIVGLLLMAFSLSMLPPLAVSLLYQDGAWQAFAIGFGVVAGLGLFFWLPLYGRRRELSRRDGFLVVALFWIVLGSAGAVPLVAAEDPRIGVTDALFESISGITTTGSTILTGIEHLPESVKFYRQQLQWLGGMGIIVLALALLPMLGVGGMQLYRAEMTGPMKDKKLTPRIAETAKSLWFIYCLLTLACALAYYLAGMSAFDAIGHSFSTVAIGGYSTYDASIGHFDSHAIELIASVFILISAINFGLHFLAWRSRGVVHYFRDPEFRFFLLWMAGLLAVVILAVWYFGVHDDPWTGFVKATFNTISVATTTGYASDDFAAWPAFLPVILIFASFVGACAASTGGGIKAVRILLLIKQGGREIMRLVHPAAEIPVKLGSRVVPDRVISAVWAFFSVYVAVYVLMMVLLMATGEDQVTAFSAVAATLNNLGPGLGDVASNMQTLDPLAKWAMMLAMVLGRLEIFTLLVILTPAFWRR